MVPHASPVDHLIFEFLVLGISPVDHLIFEFLVLGISLLSSKAKEPAGIPSLSQSPFPYFEYPNLSKFTKGEKECITLAWKISCWVHIPWK